MHKYIHGAQMIESQNFVAAMNDAAGAASKIIISYFSDSKALTTSEKGKADFVSSADLAAEQAILRVLDGRFPGPAFLIEESGGAALSQHYAGSLIRSTALQISFVASRFSACPLRQSWMGKSSRALFMTR